MCGIAGKIGAPGDVTIGERMSAAIAHRGPEDSGRWDIQSDVTSGFLLHRRLRIIDLSDRAHQPMISPDGRVALAFNGEIYNYLEVRETLEEQGVDFQTSSDTEVLLMAYLRWGAECVTRLEGMFAFAIWDGCSNELLLARDRLGKKPLFFYSRGGEFIFGSELKAILCALDRTPEIDYQALDDYLTYLYIPYPKTIFSGIRQVPPATFLQVRFSGRSNGPAIESHTYWNPLTESGGSSGGQRTERLRGLVKESVEKRLVSDVPLGLLLSGGMDSTTILAMMSGAMKEPVRSFSVSFPNNERYDETSHASLAARAFRSEHRILEADVNWSGTLAKVVSHFDQPFGNPTALLAYKLSKLTRQFVTVALAGDGGDEIFGGYPRYVGAYVSRIPRSLPGFVRNKLIPSIGSKLSDDASGRHQARRLREFFESAGLPFIDMYVRWISYYSPEQKKAIYGDGFASQVGDYDATDFLKKLYAEAEELEPLNRLSYVDIKSFLCCNVLEYADRMSMAHALELRAPFTDRSLVEFCLHLPFSWKFRFGKCKWILKRAMQPILPEEILSKQKLGFNPPAGQWLRGELKNLCAALLSDETLRKRGLFRSAAVRGLIDDHVSGRRDYSLHLWALMMLELWFQIYIDGRSTEAVQESIDASVMARPRAALVSAN